MRDQEVKQKRSANPEGLDVSELGEVSYGTPLVSPEQEQDWNQKLERLEARQKSGKLKWGDYLDQRRQMENTRLTEITDMAKQRAEEYLNALLVIVGSRGAKPLDFFKAFTLSADPAFKDDIAADNTPENRRTLHSMLLALKAIPGNWNEFDYRRFLTGQGEQRKAKYDFPGKSLLKKSSLRQVPFDKLKAGKGRQGWRAEGINFVCKQLAGDESMYAEVLRLRTGTAPEDVLAEEEEAEVAPPDTVDEEEDFYVVDAKPSYSFAPEPKPDNPRDEEFISKLCEMLEERGLADPPTKPARRRGKVKEFQPGDAISRANLKDLPLPAHIRAMLERRVSPEDPWCSGLVEQVVTAVNKDGSYAFSWVTPGELEAYADHKAPTLPQKLAYGAIYLGPWTGSQESGRSPECEFEINLP